MTPASISVLTSPLFDAFPFFVRKFACSFPFPHLSSLSCARARGSLGWGVCIVCLSPLCFGQPCFTCRLPSAPLFVLPHFFLPSRAQFSRMLFVAPRFHFFTRAPSPLLFGLSFRPSPPCSLSRLLLPCPPFASLSAPFPPCFSLGSARRLWTPQYV